MAVRRRKAPRATSLPTTHTWANGAVPYMNIIMNRRPNLVAGFTLVEALVAISITALAGSVLLLGVTSSVQSTDEALRQTVALGLAQQLMDEVVASPSLDALDEYHGSGSEPPLDHWGVALGTEDGRGGRRHPNFHAAPRMLDPYGREVAVYRVDPAEPAVRQSSETATAYRLVEVRVTYRPPNQPVRELAKLHRVVAYVAPFKSLE